MYITSTQSRNACLQFIDCTRVVGAIPRDAIIVASGMMIKSTIDDNFGTSECTVLDLSTFFIPPSPSIHISCLLP